MSDHQDWSDRAVSVRLFALMKVCGYDKQNQWAAALDVPPQTLNSAMKSGKLSRKLMQTIIRHCHEADEAWIRRGVRAGLTHQALTRLEAEVGRITGSGDVASNKR